MDKAHKHVTEKTKENTVRIQGPILSASIHDEFTEIYGEHVALTMEAGKRSRRDELESEPAHESDSESDDGVGDSELDSVSDSDSNIDPNMVRICKLSHLIMLQLLCQQEFQVEFEAKNIEAGDFHGIRRLLKQVCLNDVVYTEISAALQ